jgi:hypothetical protein
MRTSGGLFVVALAIACLSGPVAAQLTSTDEVNARNPVKLDKSALESLVPGSTSESVGRNGNQRKWENMAGGRLRGSSRGAHTRIGGWIGEGKWVIQDDGKLCVEIGWTGPQHSSEEKWCAPVVKAGDDYYVMFQAGAMKMSFSK